MHSRQNRSVRFKEVFANVPNLVLEFKHSSLETLKRLYRSVHNPEIIMHADFVLKLPQRCVERR